MEQIIQYLKPPVPEKTWSERMRDWIFSNPVTAVELVPVAVVAWYSFPVFLAMWSWAPWVYVGYKVHKKTQVISQVYDFVKRYNPFG